MRNIRKLSIPVIALGLLAQTAAAQDATPFDGPYAGLQAGYTWIKSDLDLNGTTLDELDLDGFEGGAYGGYAMTNGGAYGAVEIEGNLSAVDETFYGLLDVESDYSFGISAIAGGLVTPNLLLYGRVGYQYLHGELSLPGYSQGESFHGARLGAGVDYAFTGNLHARAEYTHTFYGDESYSDGFDTLSLDPSQHLVRVGVHYMF